MRRLFRQCLYCEIAINLETRKHVTIGNMNTESFYVMHTRCWGYTETCIYRISGNINI